MASPSMSPRSKDAADRRSSRLSPCRACRRPRKARCRSAIGTTLSAGEQEYNPTPIINEIRSHVASWRALPNPADWGVTPTTARLLTYWRSHQFSGVRPFFCQIEAVETIIWLTEVASRGPQIPLDPRPSRKRQRRVEPRTLPPRDEDGDRGRQDDCHGDAHRLAYRERRARAGQQPLQQGLPDRHARHHDPRPLARPEARGHGELLRVPRTGPARSRRRHRQGEDRHHQLSRVPQA